ncbi:MAG: hypothetical protein LAT79_01450 [Kiritimatiellae bacterium]|nr:hypothetical protein [Kiritimatiellia bacterium]
MLVSIFIFAWFTWPLPRHVQEGVVSSHRPEIGGPRYMIPGDHLQLMYHFELMKGFLTGQTPWFHNLYEFNTGDDAATLKYDMYYAPFSWVYTLGALGGSPGLGWNLASFASIFFSVWGTWLLVRRFPAPLAVQLTAAAVGVGLPYRWITLLHGSPTGFAMVYVPWVLYGLHVSVIDRTSRGGWIAGLSLLLSAWGDIHTFFFLGLLTPFWCLFVFYLQPIPSWKSKELRNLIYSLRGFIVFGFIVGIQALAIRLYLTDGSMAGGRTVEEVMLFSPEPGGLLSLNPDHTHNHLYLTYSVLILVIFSIAISVKFLKRRAAISGKRLIILHTSFFLLLISLVILALGPSLFTRISPLYWRMLTRIIPPYGMIRQTTKIYAILPPLLAVFIILPFSSIHIPSAWNRKLNVIALILGSLFLMESQSRMSPTICFLDEGSAAYRAIREHAESLGEHPRALGIVLWPGDSHWTSVKQYFAMMDRVRLVNGYRPNIPGGYYEHIFLRFKPLNQGFASDELLDELLDRGIRNLILHEDAFPEQVSPFSVSATLSHLLDHPRIRLLKQDQAVWAFEIMSEASEEHRIQTDWSAASSARMWHLIRFVKPESRDIIADEDAFRNQLLRLSPESDPVSIPHDSMPHFENLRMLLRVRGQGQLTVVFQIGSLPSETVSTPIDTGDWTWVEIPFPTFEGFQQNITTELNAPNGFLEMDLGTLQMGSSTLDLSVGESMVFSAPTLFRAGYTDLTENHVVLHPEKIAFADVFYGPRQVFPKGKYRITLHYHAESQKGEIGSFRIREPMSSQTAPVILPGGDTVAELDITLSEPYPLVFAFTYFRTDVVRLVSVEIHRVE